MPAPVEQPSGNDRRGETRGSASPLRMRVAPQAVIIVTPSNRIVLVESPDWSMDEFNRREIVEIIVPEGFATSDHGETQSCHEPAHLPVDLVVGRGEAISQFTNLARKSLSIKPTSDTEYPLEPGLIRLADDPIFASLADGTIVSWNAGARNLYGYSTEEIVGKPVSLVIPYELRTSEERNREKVLTGDAAAPYDTLRLSKAGVTTTVSVSKIGRAHV
jgi:PAS domain-containing protein